MYDVESQIDVAGHKSGAAACRLCDLRGALGVLHKRCRCRAVRTLKPERGSEVSSTEGGRSLDKLAAAPCGTSVQAR